MRKRQLALSLIAFLVVVDAAGAGYLWRLWQQRHAPQSQAAAQPLRADH